MRGTYRSLTTVTFLIFWMMFPAIAWADPGYEGMGEMMVGMLWGPMAMVVSLVFQIDAARKHIFKKKACFIALAVFFLIWTIGWNSFAGFDNFKYYIWGVGFGITVFAFEWLIYWMIIGIKGYSRRKKAFEEKKIGEE